MFVPPEKRHPGPPPQDPSQPRRELTRREKAIVPWLVGIVLLSVVLAPIGGSTVFEALLYLLHR